MIRKLESSGDKASTVRMEEGLFESLFSQPTFCGDDSRKRQVVLFNELLFTWFNSLVRVLPFGFCGSFVFLIRRKSLCQVPMQGTPDNRFKLIPERMIHFYSVKRRAKSTIECQTTEVFVSAHFSLVYNPFCSLQPQVYVDRFRIQ